MGKPLKKLLQSLKKRCKDNGGNRMNVQVIGLGYIGLPTAAIIAEAGHQVHGYDISDFVINSIKSGKLHIIEKGLDILVKDQIQNGRLVVDQTIKPADFHIICVPTPFKLQHGGHQPDLSYILSAIKALSPVLTNGVAVILESTSPVGTTEHIAREVKAQRPELKVAGIDNDIPRVSFAYCPERIIPGDMIREFKENDRIIGGIDAESTNKTIDLYNTFIKGKCLKTTANVAEMVKLTENSFRDVNIAFANELSILCDKQNLPVEEVIRLANCHPRVNILNPGPGVGGHCIAIDPWFIVDADPENARLIRTARIINDEKPNFVIKKVRQAVRLHPDSKIYCLGLTYKPNVDDFRESPSLKIVKELTEEYGYTKVIGVDPYLESYRETNTSRLNLIKSIDMIEENAIILALVGHSEFKTINITGEHTILDFGGLFLELQTKIAIHSSVEAKELIN